jgi:hypothetical protein
MPGRVWGEDMATVEDQPVRGRCPYCGIWLRASSQAKLAKATNEHLMKPGPCSDELMREVVEGKDRDRIR